MKTFLRTILNISARMKGRMSERILSKNETTFKTCISHNFAGIPLRKSSNILKSGIIIIFAKTSKRIQKGREKQIYLNKFLNINFTSL